MRAFLHLFAQHLPCPICRKHFQALLEQSLDDDALASRDTLVRFLHDAHNEVNLRLGKRVWTLEEHYRAYRPSSSEVRWEEGCILVLVVVCLVIATMRIKYFRRA